MAAFIILFFRFFLRRLAFENYLSILEKYNSFSQKDIRELYQDKDQVAWERIKRTRSKKVLQELEELGITNMGQLYTSRLKYSKVDFDKFSTDYLQLLKDQDFWNF